MFRILSLDGGGIMGAFSASVLATLEADTGRSVKDHFDLITGTSTGGILALGLGLGFTASELLDFYRTRGPEIFPATSRFDRARASLRQLFGPKLTQAPLRAALYEILGGRRFGEASSRLVIPAYDAVGGRIYLFKTAHHPRFVNDLELPAVEVALATSAAPTFFEAARPASLVGAQYVDGGVWANTPTLVGLIEAMAFLGKEPSEIDVLSVGTTSTAFNVARHSKSGAFRWNVGLIDLLMNSQSESALAMSDLLLDGRMLRIDHVVREGEFAMDDGRIQSIEKLIALGRNQAQTKAVRDAVLERFLNGSLRSTFEPFQRSTL